MGVAENYLYWNAGASAIGSIGGAIAGGMASDAQLKATKYNIKTSQENYLRQLVASTEQIQAIDRQLSDIMSARGIQAMKSEAKMRAAASGSGISGGSVDEVVNQSKYDELFDNQVAISRARTYTANVQRENVTNWINFVSGTQQQVDAMPEGQGLLGSLFAGLGTGLDLYSGYVAKGGEDVIGNTISGWFQSNVAETSKGSEWNKYDGEVRR